MTETLRELNEEAIKDGLLLPDGLSYRKDFSDKLGQDLTGTEDRGYRVIHELTEKSVEGIAPAGVDEIFKNTYMTGEPYQVTERDIGTVEGLVMRIRKKLGKTAVECAYGRNGYRSRRKVIELAVESNVNIEQGEVSPPEVELPALPVVETPKELNEEAIKDGLLLPDGQSHRKDFNLLLGKPLSDREEKAYLLIHGHFGPITAEELAREIYPDDFKIYLGYQAIENIWVICWHLKKKLGETAIISRGRLGYLSRRSLIMSDVEESVKKVSLPGIEPGSRV